MRVGVGALVCAAGFGVSGCAATDAGSGATDGSGGKGGGLRLLPDELLDGALTGFQETNGVPAAFAAVQIPGYEPWVGAAGVRDLETEEPAAPGDHVRAGSGTKMFTAGAILKLAQEGEFDLDATLGDLLPGLMYNFRQNEITLENLMNHTSGIMSIFAVSGDLLEGTGAVPAPGCVPCEPDLSNFMQCCNVYTSYCATPQAPIDPVKVIEAVNATFDTDENHDQIPDCQSVNGKVNFPEGCTLKPASVPAVWNYSNSNYILLGMIIESTAGKTYNEYLRQEVFAPLGLSSTVAPDGDDLTLPRPFANGYTIPSFCPIADQKVPLLKTTEISPALPWAAGNVISTMPDMAAWMRALAGGAFLNQEYTEIWRQGGQVELTLCPPGTPRGDNGWKIHYGLGNTKGEIEELAGFMGHRGQILGYDCSFQYWAEKDTVVVACSSQTFSRMDCSQPEFPWVPVETSNPVIVSVKDVLLSTVFAGDVN